MAGVVQNVGHSNFESYFILVNRRCGVCGKAAGRMREGLPAVMTKVIACSQKPVLTNSSTLLYVYMALVYDIYFLVIDLHASFLRIISL